jgi:hypothetical protein
MSAFPNPDVVANIQLPSRALEVPEGEVRCPEGEEMQEEVQIHHGIQLRCIHRVEHLLGSLHRHPQKGRRS